MKKFVLIAGLVLGTPYFLHAETPKEVSPAEMLDPSVDPCDNFYQYACGGWMNKTEIPGEKAYWGRGFSGIDERNHKVFKTILEDLRAGKADPENPDGAALGTLYGSCMDQEKSEKGSLATLNAEFKKISKLKEDQVFDQIIWSHQHGIDALFSFGPSPDFKNPMVEVANFDQGGLNLPSNPLYLEESNAGIREIYKTYLKNILKLSGDSDKQATADAEAVLAFETKLAKVSMTPIERRDPVKSYNPYNLATLKKDFPQIPWEKFAAAMNVKDFKGANLMDLNYIKALGPVLAETPLSTWKPYFKSRLVTSTGKTLPKAYLDEYFNAFGKGIFGLKELPPRWKICADTSADLLGFVLGRSFVNREFKGDSKALARDLILRVEKELGLIFDETKWMDAKTRTAAKEKLSKLGNLIGYPDHWRSYAGLTLEKDSYLFNRWAANAFEINYQTQKIGKAVDRDEWETAPLDVNAFYSPQYMRMTFLAGILQPPFFDAEATSTENYAGIGMVMGHEMTHAFDDQGRQYDSNGAMRDWWTKKTAAEFNKRGQCLSKQYDAYPTAGGGHVKGDLVLGEAIGDQGGLKLSHRAWLKTLPAQVRGNKKSLVEEEKKFFLAYAQTWCSKSRDAYEQMVTNEDPHPPDRYRVNGTLANMPAFAQAYACKKESKMVPKNMCVVW